MFSFEIELVGIVIMKRANCYNLSVVNMKVNKNCYIHAFSGKVWMNSSTWLKIDKHSGYTWNNNNKKYHIKVLSVLIFFFYLYLACVRLDGITSYLS